MNDKTWTYKNHDCRIEFHVEPDVCKAWHTVTKPNGETVFADISPYDTTKGTVNHWIDAGYPSRVGVGPLQYEDVKKNTKLSKRERSRNHLTNADNNSIMEVQE